MMSTKRETMWAERKVVVERWEGSGLSMAEFCRQEGIGYLAFASWRKKLSLSSEAAQGFAELVVTPAEPPRIKEATDGALLEIALPGGIVLRAFGGADFSLLRAAVEAVRSC